MSDMSNRDQREVYSPTNPAHINITSEPPGTPWDVRLGLTLLPARYVGRSLIGSLTNSETPSFLRKLTLFDLFSERSSQRAINQINQFYQQHTGAIERTFGRAPSPNKQSPQHTWVPKGNPIFDAIEPVLGEQNRAIHKKALGTSRFANNSLEWAIKKYYETGNIALTPISERNIRSEMVTKQFDHVYSNALGVGSLAMSMVIRRNVLREMNSIYSETVAYELGKRIDEVTEEDIFASNNQIIQSTVGNFNRNQWIRFGISALPFLKNVPSLRFMNTGDFAVGLWGALWAYDVWGRDPTMLETFHDFIKDKLNPLYGIGDKITGADVLNIYQLYAFKFHPERAFKVLAPSDSDESQLWARSERIFARVAQLMNDSYNFKHTTTRDPETGLPVAKANFTLPKFIYLLGHELINAREPEWTMAYIEIANKFGMEAVKEVNYSRREGAALNEVLAKYPVDLHPMKDENGKSPPSVLQQEDEQDQKRDTTFHKDNKEPPPRPSAKVQGGSLSQTALRRPHLQQAHIAG